MIKFIGAFVIIISASYIGFAKSAVLRKRMNNLLEFKTALNLLANEINFAKNPIDKALANIAEVSALSELFIYISDRTDELGIKNAWKCGIEKFADKLYLHDDDKAVILILANELGMSDTESQIKNVDYVKTLVHKQYECAEHEYNTSAKMYRSLGILGGLFTAVLFA